MRTFKRIFFLWCGMGLMTTGLTDMLDFYLKKKNFESSFTMVQDFGGRFNGVFVDNTNMIAYLAQGEGGLGIYDLNNPGKPLLIGTYNTDGSAQDIKIDGDYAYVADKFSGLKIIDISKPTSPVLVGAIDTLGIATKLAVYNNYVYLADYGRGLLVIDVSNPTDPVMQNAYNTDGRALGVTISADGDSAYVADRSALLVFDIADKNATPILKHAVATERDAYSIALNEAVLYVANGAVGLQVYDISDPLKAPVLINTIDTSGLAKNMRIDGDVLLVADGTSGLTIYDISDPTNPLIISEFNTVGDATDLAILGNDVVVADGYGGLSVLDISDLENPILKGYVVTIGSGSAIHIDTATDTAYIADYYNGLVIINISNPLAPKIKGHFPIEGDGYFRGCFDMFVEKPYAYIANGKQGLRIIDISDSTNLQQISLTPLTSRSWPARGIDKQGQYVYLAADEGGIIIVDANDTFNPVVIGSNRFEDINEVPHTQAKDVIVHNNHAILANGFDSFAISDISNPANPLNAATLFTEAFTPPKGDGHGIEIWGHYAFLGHFGGGLAVIDISTPASPEIISTATGEVASISNLFINGNFLYASDSANQSQVSEYHSLLVWDLTGFNGFLPDSANETYALGGRYPAMDILNTHLFLAGEGFKVLDIPTRFIPSQSNVNPSMLMYLLD